MIESGKLFIYEYLPRELIPEEFEELDFDEFFRLYAMADLVRDMRIRDLEVATNHGFVASFPDVE